MDWSEERYVRSYTRDTAEWVALPWQSRAVWLEMLRKFDRTGVISLGKLGRKGLPALLRMPVEVVEVGVDGLVADGCLEEHDGYVIAPNFIEAQEAKTRPVPDAERQKNRRDRLKAKLSKTLDTGHMESRSVTAVTESHDVTPVPNLAVPSRAKPKEASLVDADPPLPEEIQLWNLEAHPDFGKVKKLSDKGPRIKASRKLVPDLSDWSLAIARLNAWSHAHGQSDTHWIASFSYLIGKDKNGASNLVALVEGTKGGRISEPRPLLPPEPELTPPPSEPWRSAWFNLQKRGVGHDMLKRFARLEQLGDGPELRLRAPDGLARDWIAEHWGTALAEAAGKPVRLEVAA